MTTRFTILSILFASIFSNMGWHTAHGQYLEWAKSIQGSATNESYGNAIDRWGNVYTIGTFKGSADFDPGPGIFSMTSQLQSTNDVCVFKVDPKGNLLWAKRMGSKKQDEGLAIAVDLEGNAYLTGNFRDTCDFNPGTAVYNLPALGSNDIFIVKLSKDGNFIWAKQIGGGKGAHAPSSIGVDAYGDIVLAGYFYDSLDFDPGTGKQHLISAGSNDAFLAKYNSNGEYIWAMRMGGKASELCYSLSTGLSGDIAITGIFGSAAAPTAEFGNLTLTTSGAQDIFVAKINKNGNVIWAKSMGGSGLLETGKAIAIDNEGNIYTTGYFGFMNPLADFHPGSGTYNLDASKGNIFLSKLDSSGEFIWAKQIGNNSNSTMLNSLSLKIDQHDKIYLTGMFYQSANFDPNSENVLLVADSNSQKDVFVSKYDSDGKFIWLKHIMSLGAFGTTLCNAICLDTSSGSIYITGSFSPSADFSPGDNSTVIHTAVESNRDIYIAKLSCITTDSLSITACRSYSYNGHEYEESGDYVNTFVNTIGCDSTIVLHLSITRPDTSIVVKDQTLLAKDQNASYQWLNCKTQTLIENATSQEFTATEAGAYAVILTLNECSDTSTCYSVQPASLKEDLHGQAIALYPNPNKGQFTLQSNQSLTNASLHLFNILGQSLLKKEGLQGTQVALDISNHPDGVYLLQIRQNDQNMIFKIVKE